MKLDVKFGEDAKCSIVNCSRGTPRIANRLLRRVRDFDLVKEIGVVTSDIL